MKKIALTPILVAVAILVGACSSVPRTTAQLDQTRVDFAAAQGNPNVARFAASEMQQADTAMAEANTAANHDDSVEKIDKLASIAQQRIAVAQQVATQRYAAAEAARNASERDQIRLDQRMNEAEQAKNNAAQAQLAAQAATNAAQAATNAAAEADRQRLDAQGKTLDAQAHAAQLQAELNDLSAKQTQRGMVITLSDVLFNTDQARLNPEGMRTAQKLADVLQQNPQRAVLVEGFTDNTGNMPHNQDLSERRAEAVRSALTGMGIAGGRVTIHGYGPAYPVAANDSSSNRQLNRRVEIVLSDDTGVISQR